MGDSFVELEWRVVMDGYCLAAFRDLEPAELHAKHVNGDLVYISHRYVSERKDRE